MVQGTGNYPTQYNVFTPSAINKIAEQSLDGVSKKRSELVGKFNHGVITNGSQMEEVFYGLAQRHSYNPTQTTFDELFGVERGINQTFYHTNAVDRKFKLTINQKEMSKMVQNPTTVGDVLTAKLTSLNASEYAEETKDLVNVLENPIQGKLPTIAVGDVASDDPAVSDKALRKFTKEVKQIASKASMPNRNNLSGVENVTPKEDLVLVLSPETNASTQINMFADMFNMDQAEVNITKHVLDVDFADSNTVALLLSSKFLITRDIIDAAPSMPVGPTLAFNSWRIRQQLISTSPFAFGVRFVKSPVTDGERILVDDPFEEYAVADEEVVTYSVEGLDPKAVYKFDDVIINAANASTRVNITATTDFKLGADKTTGVVTVTFKGFDNKAIPSGAVFNYGLILQKQTQAGDAPKFVDVDSVESHVSKYAYYGNK